MSGVAVLLLVATGKILGHGGIKLMATTAELRIQTRRRRECVSWTTRTGDPGRTAARCRPAAAGMAAQRCGRRWMVDLVTPGLSGVDVAIDDEVDGETGRRAGRRRS
jgi:hypothetical protein